MAEKSIKRNYHRSFAYVDLDAIEHNFDEMKKLLDPSVKVLAIMKADAYGHGAVRIARLLESRADYFAVATVEEGITLREAGIEKPILILSFTSSLEYDLVLENDLITTIYDLEHAQWLSDIAEENGIRAKIHIAVDTGMGRIGFADNEESADIIEEISKLRGIEIEGLFSHYACADEKDKSNTKKQTERFDRFIEMLEKRGVNIPIKHICNSAGVIDLDKHYDMVRFGISMYGLYPSDEVDKSKLNLMRAMQVISHVIHVKTVEKGEGIGYGQIYHAPERRKIATVCIGYADGYNRSYTGKGYLLIRGKKAPVVGKVCMDQIMVDVTDIEGVDVGDHAIVLGKSRDAEITAEELGSMIDSFGYEVICNFMPRVSRVYRRQSKVI